MATDQTRIVMEALEGVAERVIRAIAINTTAELIERTPVDIGWARANWVPALGAAYTGGALDSPDASSVAAAQQQQQAGTASVVGYRLSSGRVFITNNVPYVPILNQGSSQQAPAGFVQDAIEAGVTSLRNGVP